MPLAMAPLVESVEVVLCVLGGLALHVWNLRYQAVPPAYLRRAVVLRPHALAPAAGTDQA